MPSQCMSMTSTPRCCVPRTIHTYLMFVVEWRGHRNKLFRLFDVEDIIWRVVVMLQMLVATTKVQLHHPLAPCLCHVVVLHLLVQSNIEAHGNAHMMHLAPLTCSDSIPGSPLYCIVGSNILLYKPLHITAHEQ